MQGSIHRIKQPSHQHRQNLPGALSARTGEAAFLRAFEKAWFVKHHHGLAAGEFGLPGFGVADLLWVAWKPEDSEEDFTAVSLAKSLSRRHLIAFEAKIKDWQRALQQAFRYRYFADKAVVLMPAANVKPALQHLHVFREHAVGLWSFDPESGVIREHFTPTRVRALSAQARQKAVELLSSKINLRKLRKECDAAPQRVQVRVI